MVTRRGQVTSELTIAMFVALLILFGCFKTALWFSERYVRRQVAYEQSRPQRPLSPQGGINREFESKLPKMDVFGESKQH